MRAKALGIRFGFLLCLFLLFFLAGSVSADTVNYVYDNLGRLAMTVSSNGTKILYTYDQAGHLISASRMSVNEQPPMLTGISPAIAFIGTEVSITMTGENLLTTESVKTDNPGLRIVNFSTTDNKISINAQLQNTAATGLATFTVTTLTGSASISLNLLSLTFMPTQIVVTPGTSESVSVHIDGLTSDYNLPLTNENPAAVSAPQSVVVPVAGSTTFTVNSIAQGSSVIAAGNSAVSVFVSEPFAGTLMAGSRPVSVLVSNPFQNGSIASRPVSVEVGNFLNSGTLVSPLVSAKIQQ